MTRRVFWTTLCLSSCIAFAAGIVAGVPTLRHTESFFFQVELTSNVPGSAQLFFDIGRGLIEEDSALDEVHANQTERHQFALPLVSIYNLRFDPINDQASVTMSAPVIVNSNGKVIHRFTTGEITVQKQISSFERHNDTVTMTCADGEIDPSLNIAPPPRFAAPLVPNDFQRAVTVAAITLGLLGCGLALASYHPARQRLSLLALFLRGRPIVTLIILSGAGVLLQFHPLFFPPEVTSDSARDSSSLLAKANFTTYNLGSDNLSSPVHSNLAWTSIFMLVARLTHYARWAAALGISTAWWAYVLGCAMISWKISRSLGTAIVIGGCALLSNLWTGILPLSIPAVAAAPWALIAWGGLASAPRSYKTIFLAGSAIFFADLEMIAAEGSLRVAVLVLATSLAGLLQICLQPQPASHRILRGVIGAGLTGLFWTIAKFALGAAILAPGDGSAQAAETAVLSIAPYLGVSFFEGILLPSSPGAIALPFVTLVVLAGLAWGVTRSEETFRKPEYIALALPTVLLFALTSGALQEMMVTVWPKFPGAAAIQHAAWYTMAVFTTILATFGFAGLIRVFAMPGAATSMGKATLLFFAPFALYYGTTQAHAYYSFRTAYLVSIIIGWIVVHVALSRFRKDEEGRYSFPFIFAALALAWWVHGPYLHLILQHALTSP